MTKYGFTMWAFKQDCFIETTAKRRTNALAIEFINKINIKTGRNIPTDPATVEAVKSRMRPARLELHMVQAGRFAGQKWINIYGEDFSHGTDVSENPFNHCIVV